LVVILVGMKIVVVEDQAVSRTLLRAQLAGEGRVVLEAVDGLAALALLEREAVDVIVSDILMPGMDGYRLCYEIRAQARYDAIPIIIYTANYTSAEDEKAGLELGADAFLRKPADAATLLATVYQVMRKPRPSQVRVAEEGVQRMKLYNERLVAKLEERNRELERMRDELHQANESLEARVRERTTELEAANQQLESFAFFVSHELRSPLRAIEGFSSILREDYAGSASAEGKRMFIAIERNTARMGRLIEDLLRFSRLTREPVLTQTFDMVSLVHSALAELRPQWEPRKVEIVVGDLPAAMGDESLLKQVLLNLLNNALKFTRPRDKARVEIGSQHVDGEWLYFIRDNGIGFDMSQADRLFNAFERLHTDAQFEGSGIGLEIVQNIIRRHGGRVWAESAPDQGATFFFVLTSKVSPPLAIP